MKIIDEKGRLFGKINAIDFLVVLFLFCFIPAFYFGYKIMTRKVEVAKPEKEFVEIEVNCRFVKLRPKVLKLILVGDKELDENEEVIGEIINIDQSEPYKYEFDIGKGQKLIKEDPILKQIEAKLKLKAEVRKDKPYYKDKVIKIGLPLEFNINEYIFTAVPFKEKEEEVLKDETIDLFVTLKGLDRDTLKQISVGDKELDEAGETMAEILSLGKIENSSLELNLGASNFVRVDDSRKKQISTKMRLRCQTKDVKGNKRLYFKGKEVEHNRAFEFKTGEYKAEGVVAKAFEIISPLKEKWISLQFKLSGVVPEIAKIVQTEDMERSPSGAVVAKIKSVINNKPSQVLTLRKNDFITLKHPFNKDILLALDVQCTVKEGVYYFKNYPVKMGNNLTFATDLYSVSGTIVGMEIK